MARFFALLSTLGFTLQPVLHLCIEIGTFPLPGGILRLWKCYVVMGHEEFVMTPQNVSRKSEYNCSTNYTFLLSDGVCSIVAVVAVVAQLASLYH